MLCFLLDFLKIIGLVEEFAIVEIFDLHPIFRCYKYEGEWFCKWGRTRIIIQPRGWRKQNEDSAGGGID